MGFPFLSTGCFKRAKERWNESHTINGSAPAPKTKEKPGGVSWAFHQQNTPLGLWLSWRRRGND